LLVSRGPADVVFRLNEQLASETNRKSIAENKLAADTKGEVPTEIPSIPVNHKFAVAALSSQSLAILSTEPLPGWHTMLQRLLSSFMRCI